MKNLFAILLVSFAIPAFSGPNMEKYNKSCVICHANGTANAPKTGDVAAWAPRMEKGMDVLLKSVETGVSAMPPKGMCFDCTTEEVKALIEYMAAPAE